MTAFTPHVPTIVDTHPDLAVPVIVRAAELAWHPSPNPKVRRKSLYRQGGEYGPVTSFVRYEAGSSFAGHVHPAGEEILVLGGVFSDEHGHYPAGSYLLNPMGTGHAPFSKEGCLLFVHLRQYDGPHRKRTVTDTNALAWQQTSSPGIEQKPLYQQSEYPELISLERWSPGERRSLGTRGGIAELLVLEGTVATPQGNYGAHTWFRLPQDSGDWHFCSGEGCTVYLRLNGQSANRT